MRIKSSAKKKDDTCGEGNYCVQLYSRRASLLNEFCLDKKQNDIADIEAAEKLLREAIAPCDFVATISLIGEEGTENENILQFDHRPVKS